MLLPQCVLLFTASLLMQTTGAAGRGAGRAFPIESENYVIDSFSRINPGIDWDPTNFLVDLSGQAANCDAVDAQAKTFDSDRLTLEGESISGVVDWIDGSGTDVDSVNQYIKAVIDRWTNRRTYDRLIAGARVFGCSVRPGCRGAAVVSCLFSPGGTGGDSQNDQGLEPEKITALNAVAFTPEQYDLVEVYIGKRWDHSHFLENLSGRETNCAMITAYDWPFVQTRQAQIDYDMRISNIYGHAQNFGSTQDAMERILANFKKIESASQLGCSLIPDCIVNNNMYVVVACLYQEQ